MSTAFAGFATFAQAAHLSGVTTLVKALLTAPPPVPRDDVLGKSATRRKDTS